MARIEDMERRLLNWSRWRAGLASGGLGYASANIEDRVDGEGYDAQAIVPTVDCEASVTQDGVMALPSHLRATLEAVYLSGGTMKRKAERLCCPEGTIKARVWEAHRKLQAWLADRTARSRAERDRVETLLARARP